MTTTTSSADPQALFHYADTATQINGDLEHEAQVLGTVLDRFAATCTEYRFGVGSHLADDLRAYVQQIRPLDEWVWQVGIDFQHADQRGEVDNAPPPAQQKPSLWDRMTDRAGDLVDQAKEFEDRFGDTIHGVLDVAGMIPVVGEVADGLNAAYYLAEGDYKNAAISAAGMLPGGQAATGARLAVKVAGAAAGAGAAAAAARRAARHADDVVDGAQGANRAGDAIPPKHPLHQRADEIHSALLPDKIAYERRTTGIVAAKKDGETVYYVGSNEQRLTPKQRSSLREGEYEAVGTGHAEETAFNAARKDGAEPFEYAASRDICAERCEPRGQLEGATPRSPLEREQPPKPGPPRDKKGRFRSRGDQSGRSSD